MKTDKWMLGFIATAILVALILAWPGKSRADNPHDQPPTPPEYITFYISLSEANGPVVWYTNSSDGAPVIARGTPVSKALAYAGSYGFRLLDVGGREGFMYILVKP